MKILYNLSITLLVVILLAACGIDNFESNTELNPPLGLQATSSNKQIFLTFTAYNAEEYFAGYNVLVGKDETVIKDRRGFNLKNESTGMLPFLTYNSFTSPQTIKLIITKNSNNSLLQVGTHLYIGVAAYDALNKTNSKPSNVVHVMVTN